MKRFLHSRFVQMYSVCSATDYFYDAQLDKQITGLLLEKIYKIKKRGLLS